MKDEQKIEFHNKLTASIEARLQYEKELTETFDDASLRYKSAIAVSAALDTAAKKSIATAAHDAISSAIDTIDTIEKLYTFDADTTVYKLSRVYEVVKEITDAATTKVNNLAYFYEESIEAMRAAEYAAKEAKKE